MTKNTFVEPAAVEMPILSVQTVSDGILIEFTGGACGYFPATFLAEHLATSPNQYFLNHDPSR